MSEAPRLVCRRCERIWADAAVGDPCPGEDGGILLDETVHHAQETDPVLGKLIGERFAVIDLLGKGGMARVYRAIQQPVGRQVALKVVSPAEAANPEVRGRFFREAKAVSQLSDPGIVTLHDFGEDEFGGLFMSFELVAGRLLSEVLGEEGKLGPERVVALGVQLLGALAEAHAAGLVHRDLKPENIMIVRSRLGEERARLFDFGIAQPETYDPEDLRTREGVVLGTPRYMSPEQCARKPLDARSDLYSLGVVLFQALAGQVPFASTNPLELLGAHIEAPVPPLPTDSAPLALRAVVARALGKRPEDRYTDADAMAQALREALNPPERMRATAEIPIAEPYLLERPVSRGPSRRQLVTAGLAVWMAVLLLALWWLKGRKRPPRRLEGPSG